MSIHNTGVKIPSKYLISFTKSGSGFLRRMELAAILTVEVIDPISVFLEAVSATNDANS